MMHQSTHDIVQNIYWTFPLVLLSIAIDILNDIFGELPASENTRLSRCTSTKKKSDAPCLKIIH